MCLIATTTGFNGLIGFKYRKGVEEVSKRRQDSIISPIGFFLDRPRRTDQRIWSSSLSSNESLNHRTQFDGRAIGHGDNGRDAVLAFWSSDAKSPNASPPLAQPNPLTLRSNRKAAKDKHKEVIVILDRKTLETSSVHMSFAGGVVVASPDESLLLVGQANEDEKCANTSSKTTGCQAWGQRLESLYIGFRASVVHNDHPTPFCGPFPPLFLPHGNPPCLA